MYAAAASAFIASVAVGIVVDQLIYRIINSRATQRGWAGGRVLATALHGLPTAAGVLFGAYLALPRLPLTDEFRGLSDTGLKLLAIVVTTAFAARVLGRIVRAYTEREGSRLPSTSIFVNLARGLVWVLGGISLLAALDVAIAPMVTALGVGGLAVGLALQPTLENVFSGIQVLASRQIEPGDLIRLETGEEGTVLDVTWRNTAILQASNDVVIVPNAVIGRARITNFSTLGAEHVLVVPVTVAAGANPALVELCVREVAIDVIAETPEAIHGEEPKVRFAAVGPGGVQVNTAMRVRSYAERLPVRHEFLKRVLERFAAEGIEVTGAAAPATPTGGAR